MVFFFHSLQIIYYPFWLNFSENLILSALSSSCFFISTALLLLFLNIDRGQGPCKISIIYIVRPIFLISIHAIHRALCSNSWQYGQTTVKLFLKNWSHLGPCVLVSVCKVQVSCACPQWRNYRKIPLLHLHQHTFSKHSYTQTSTSCALICFIYPPQDQNKQVILISSVFRPPSLFWFDCLTYSFTSSWINKYSSWLVKALSKAK